MPLVLGFHLVMWRVFYSIIIPSVLCTIITYHYCTSEPKAPTPNQVINNNRRKLSVPLRHHLAIYQGDSAALTLRVGSNQCGCSPAGRMATALARTYISVLTHTCMNALKCFLAMSPSGRWVTLLLAVKQEMNLVKVINLSSALRLLKRKKKCYSCMENAH